MILIQPPTVQNWNSLVNKPSILSDDQISWDEIQNKPTTLAGYGITNGQPLGNELSALQDLSDSAGFLKKTGNGTYSIDVNSYLNLTGGTVTGDLVSTSATISSSTTTGAIRAASLGITGAIFAQNLYTAGNVGIGGWGLGGGGEKVAIMNTSSGAGTVGLNLINNSMTDNTAISLDFTPNVNIALARINALRTNAGAGGVTDLVFLNYNGSVLGETMRIKGNGNVGIGTANPSQKLDVDGSAKATSFFVGTNQVVSARRTGWSAPTGTATRTTFATSTVTLSELAETVKALIDDLTTHGLIGA